MKSRGRRSAASLSLVSNRVEVIPRQRAPSELTKEQAGIWNAVVAAELLTGSPGPPGRSWRSTVATSPRLDTSRL